MAHNGILRRTAPIGMVVSRLALALNVDRLAVVAAATTLIDVFAATALLTTMLTIMPVASKTCRVRFLSCARSDAWWYE